MSVGSRFRDLARPLVPQPIKDLYHWGQRLYGILWLKRHAPEVYWRLYRPDLPKRLQDYLLNRILNEPNSILAEPYRVGEPLDTDVLFVTDNPVPEMVKDIIALRRENPGLHCSVIVTTLIIQSKLYKRYFDQILFYKYGVDLINHLRRARAQVVVFARRGHWEGMLTRLFYDGKVIFRPGDLHTWLPGYDRQAVALLAERYLLERCEGVYHNYSPEVAEWLRDTMEIKGPLEFIPPACVPELGPAERLPKLSDRDGEYHIVYAASLGYQKEKGCISKDRGPMTTLDKFRAIASQGIHLHLFHPFLDESHTLPGMEPYFQLARESPYFHIERALPYEELLVELTKYDFGLSHATIDPRLPPLPTRFPIHGFPKNFFIYEGAEVPCLIDHLPASFWTYVEAGLPIIGTPTQRFVSETIERNGLGLTIAESAMSMLRQRLQELNRKDLERQVLEARSRLILNHEKLCTLILGNISAHGSVIAKHQTAASFS